MPHSMTATHVKLTLTLSHKEWEHLRETLQVKKISLAEATRRALLLWDYLITETGSAELIVSNKKNEKIFITGL